MSYDREKGPDLCAFDNDGNLVGPQGWADPLTAPWEIDRENA